LRSSPSALLEEDALSGPFRGEKRLAELPAKSRTPKVEQPSGQLLMRGPRDRPGLRAWLYAVVRSKTTDVIRRNVRRPSQNLEACIEKGDEPTSDEPDPAAALERQWEATMVRTAMDELRQQVSETNYRVLEMRTIEGCSEAETAAALDLTSEQVRYRKHRTQRKLQALLAVYRGEQFG